jgi:hypothetical protein
MGKVTIASPPAADDPMFREGPRHLQDRQWSAPIQVEPPVLGARLAPDGKWYVPDPDRPGKYLLVVERRSQP